jgi:hypothetical protein
MATKEWTPVMVKVTLGQVLKPCALRGCGISSNKRYRSPEGKLFLACCASHAQLAYARTLVRPAMRNRPPGDPTPIFTWNTVGASARARR